MEIIVEGKGVEYFTPDEVSLNINFKTTGNSYEEVLERGVSEVQDFINNLLLTNGFIKEDMKTRNFVIREENKYDEVTRTYVPNGYSFNQSAILKFDYEKERLSKIMAEIPKLENAPSCQVYFKIKDEQSCRKCLLTKAYKDALEQAEIIALAAGKTLTKCIKVDSKPLNEDYISNSDFDGRMMCAEKMSFNTASTITNVFTPEDIELTETLYCLWNAE